MLHIFNSRETIFELPQMNEWVFNIFGYLKEGYFGGEGQRPLDNVL